MKKWSWAKKKRVFAGTKSWVCIQRLGVITIFWCGSGPSLVQDETWWNEDVFVKLPYFLDFCGNSGQLGVKRGILCDIVLTFLIPVRNSRGGFFLPFEHFFFFLFSLKTWNIWEKKSKTASIAISTYIIWDLVKSNSGSNREEMVLRATKIKKEVIGHVPLLVVQRTEEGTIDLAVTTIQSMLPHLIECRVRLNTEPIVKKSLYTYSLVMQRGHPTRLTAVAWALPKLYAVDGYMQGFRICLEVK